VRGLRFALVGLRYERSEIAKPPARINVYDFLYYMDFIKKVKLFPTIFGQKKALIG
jgi:hypothetical protein